MRDRRPKGPPRGKGMLAPPQAFLEELVAQDLDITLFELRDALADATGVRMHHSFIANLLSRLGFTYEKSRPPLGRFGFAKSPAGQRVATERLPLIAPLVRATMATRQGKVAAR